MADYVTPLQPTPVDDWTDWDPNNPYTGDITPHPEDDPLHGYAGFGPSGGAAATATPTDAFVGQNNNTAGKDNPNLGTGWLDYANGTGAYVPGASGSGAQAVADPYGLGLTGIENDVQRQGAGYQSTVAPWIGAASTNYTQGIQARQGILDQQSGALGQFAQADAGIYNQFGQTNAALDQAGNGAIGWEAGQFGQANGLDSQNVGQLGGQLSQANYLDSQNVGQLGGQLSQANAMDAQNYGQLAALSGQMHQLTAGGYGADVASDPNDVARQESAYGTLGQFAAGDMAYQSQAAGAYADSEALADQKDALNQLKSRTDPRMTDAERYLYMQSRLQEEQSNRANRDANMRELERSGMSGSTMQLSNLNASSQQTATTRSLADLGANAKAIDRAENALVNYGNLSSTVAGQSFQQAYARGQAADTASQFNTNMQLQGTVQQGNLATQMRSADDALSMFNKSQSLQQQRFQDQYAADQQNAAWGRGTDLSDAGFQQSNNIARNAAIQSDAGFKQSQDLSTNAKTLSDAQFQQSNDMSRNATNLTNSQLTNLGQQGQRASDLARTGAQMNSDWLTGTQNFGNMGLQAQRDNTSALGVGMDAAFRGVGVQQTTDSQLNGLKMKGLDNAAEDRRAAQAEAAARTEAQRARDAAKSEADSSGLFGTPILSRDGILGVKGVPFL